MLGLIAMTADHAGMILLPRWLFLRWIGRLAMPIFAWMIAEGCRYTHSRGRYWLGIAALGIVCQTAMWLTMKSYYQGILVVFSLSVGVIFLWDSVKGKTWGVWAFPGITAGVFALTELLPMVAPLRNFDFDYGFCGVMLPVAFYIGKNKKQKLLLGLGILVMLSALSGWEQWFCLLSLPLLALYNGKRGKYRIKYLFYLYYPLHLVALYALALLV